MNNPIPFESLHFDAAIIMQYIFASGWSIKDDHNGGLFVAIPFKLRKRQLTKYQHVIRWIRSLPDVDIT